MRRIDLWLWSWPALIGLSGMPPAAAALLRVPQDHATIQAAIDASHAGDTIVVAPGRYPERIRLRPGIVLRSMTDERPEGAGRQRAERTILDGNGDAGTGPGVTMAADSVLDGFTITNVGVYDEALWQRHFETRGEDLGDEEGAVQAEGTTPAISIQGVSCTVVHCIVHHNGDVGIGILGIEGSHTSPLVADNLVYRNLGGGIGAAEGATPIMRNNRCLENLRAGIGCRNASPIIIGNECFANVRAGIGCREGARPVIRDNNCHHNRRAGIGIRMPGTAPVVEGNTCSENGMAGIGCRDGASPILRNNLCRGNELAGIGCDDRADPLIVGNDCLENKQAGIGLQGQVTAIVQGNRCLDNQLVAIGVTGGSRATIIGNKLSRQGGAPPLIAVKDASITTIERNLLTGGGVAAVLVQGDVQIRDNTFRGAGNQQGPAVWVREDATATITNNAFEGYSTAVNASQATVVIAGNLVTRFQDTGIRVKESRRPAHVYGNSGSSTNPRARLVELQGPSGIVDSNLLQPD